MKKILLSLCLGLICFYSILQGSAYSSFPATKAEIDAIHCDLNFTGSLVKNFSYTFNDTFTNPANKKIKIEEVKVHMYESDDLNNSITLPKFTFTKWFTDKNNILNIGDNGMVINAAETYLIKNTPTVQHQENLKITYTAKYFYDNGNGSFENKAFYHTECIDYKVTWCGDGKINSGETCDPQDPNKQHWGSEGCSEMCKPTVAKKIGRCIGLSSEKSEGIDTLTTNITCQGENVRKYKIECGNGQIFTGNEYEMESQKQNFSHVCTYNTPGNYTATCTINDEVSTNTCMKSLIIKKKKKIGSCHNITVKIPQGIKTLTTPVTCIGNNVHNYKINCGNGKIFTGTGKGEASESFVHICTYNKPGKYKTSCTIDNQNNTTNDDNTSNPFSFNSYSINPEVTHKCLQTIVVDDEKIQLNDSPVKVVYTQYQNIQNKLDDIYLEEKEEGEGLINIPEIIPKTGTPISERVKTIVKLKVTTQLHESRYILAGHTEKTDINFWKKVLPEIDRNADKYIVIPSNGMVVPVNSIPESHTDYNALISGKKIEFNSYLQSGSMEYSGASTKGYGEVGNKIIFGHSSYWKRDSGRYKTDFQKIIELNEGEEIWVYEKINGEYKRYKYKTITSYETSATNIGILKPGVGKNLTLFTCTPIGGNIGRWVVQAKYIDDYKEYLEKKIYFPEVKNTHKIAIGNFAKKLGNLPRNTTRSKIVTIMNKIEKKEQTITSKKIAPILQYIKYRLALTYHSQ